MARIPDADIERIKQSTDLTALVRSRGIDLKKHGKDLIGHCPFHADKTPSFVVTPGKGLFHCLGCGAAGNAIQFLERFDGLSFRHAFELLNEGRAFSGASGAAAKTGAACSRSGTVKKSTVRSMENPLDPEASDAELLLQVVDYYHQRLLETPDALEYLKRRGLYDEGAVEQFKLGFADRSLGLRIPMKNRKEGGELRTRLQSLGVLRESGHEHFNGSLVVPVFGDAGEVSELYGRKIQQRLRKGTPKHLYLPGPHAGIWNSEALSHSDIILCEAPLDALTFWVHGCEPHGHLRNVTFIYGTEGFPEYFQNALIKHRVKTVRLAYDNDEAGNRAADRDAERLAAQGIEVYRIKFPHGMDVNEYATKVTPAAKSLNTALKSAEWLGGRGESAAPTRASSSLVAIAASSPEANATAAKIKSSHPNLERSGEYYRLTLGSRVYRVGGLDKNHSLDVLKVTLRLCHNDDLHVDSLDLCRDTERRRFIDRAAEETGLQKELIKRDLGKLLLALEEVQEERLHAPAESPASAGVELSEAEHAEALAFLRSPQLIENICDVFDSCGLVGEQTNRLAAYLACTSRKLDRPLAVIIQSTSAAGKSTLMESVLALFPEEEQVKYSAMTGQSLYYLGETNLKHRILAIVEEEGAEKASYALKLLQSEGELTIASTGKDAQTGRMETQEYHVEGPTMIFLTTTAIDIDEELLNRCLVLTVDESKEQTERIHQLQRQARTLEGLQLKKKKQRLLTLLRNAQRLLCPVDVVNLWADQLTFTAAQTRTRRDHEKYLTLIDTIALLHQHQRPQQTLGEGTYITVTLEDIALANRLAPELLSRSLDELPPQTRRVFEAVKDLVRERCEEHHMDQRSALFSRREVREKMGWGVTQIRAHLERLRELEYIAARLGRMGNTFQYELLLDCYAPESCGHIGLLDVENLQVRPGAVGKNEGLSGGVGMGADTLKPLETGLLNGTCRNAGNCTSGRQETVVVS